MEKGQTPGNERERLQELNRYQILDTDEEKDFDDLVRLASHICETPISTITLIDENRQWFKARIGLNSKETSRDVSFCSHAINQSEAFMVNDSSKDNRFSDNPLVTGEPHIRFYTGIPLVSNRGFRLGTLCVIDHKPKELSATQLTALHILTGQVMKLLDLRLTVLELKEARKQITKSEKLYRLLSDNSSDMIALADEDRKFEYISPSVKEIIGYHPEELIGKSLYDLVHPDDLEFVRSKGDNIRKKITTIERIEMRLRKQNNIYIWVEAEIKLFYDESTQTDFVQSSIRDINDKKEIEAKLLESERKHRLISTNSKDVIAMISADVIPLYTFLSPSVKEVFGYEPEELIGKSPFEIIYEDDLALVREDVHPASLQGKPQMQQNRVVKKDGTIMWTQFVSNPAYDDDGNIVGILAIIRDITERKEFETQLKIEKEKAEEANRAKSQFLSTMSHEIRTPLNAIIGLTNLMLENAPREDQMENLTLLKFSGENLLTIINDILDLNKIEAGKVELEMISFNLKEIIQQYVHLFENRAVEKGIDLTLELSEGLPTLVLGDPVRLGQVLNNLIGNAIKFTEKGGVRVIAKLIEQKTDTFLIRFEISDTGIGIKQDRITDIFELFTQASSDTTRKFGGTGLGLSISNKLLHLMDSEIYVTSEYGIGSEFSFEIRFKKGNRELTLKKDAPKIEANHVSAVRVLLVEDNKVNQIVAGNFLRKWGMAVTIANDGKEALMTVKRKSFDIVLMDLQMPEMDGYQASTRIRAMDDPYFKSLPILALTASALQEVKEKLLASGINGFITKPFRPGELREKILQLVPHKVLTPRLRNADVEKYTNGDVELKKELVNLFIDNLIELKSALQISIDKNDSEFFSRALHKGKTTVSILNDQEFSALSSEINQMLKMQEKVSSTEFSKFNRIVDDLIRDLEDEIAPGD